ncbi:MAG: hypothetical protein KAI26_07105 [Nanoarchaeota archaeon]|nr:hypothetical protein [Nanoarchaeota archaeon]
MTKGKQTQENEKIKASKDVEFIASLSGRFTIITPYESRVGIAKYGSNYENQEEIAALITRRHNGDDNFALLFRPHMLDRRRNPTSEANREYIDSCKSYLEGFMEHDFIYDNDDGEVYLREEKEYKQVKALYTLDGQRVPSRITCQMVGNRHFDIRNLKQLSRGLNRRNLDFDFSNSFGRKLSDFYHKVVEER